LFFININNNISNILFREKLSTEVQIISTLKLYDIKLGILFLVNKTNRCTEFQFHWYYYCSTCFGQLFCPSSGVCYQE